MRYTRVMTVLATLAAIMLMSCGARNAVKQAAKEAAERDKRSENLMQIGFAYRKYVKEYDKAPTKADDIIPLLDGSAEPIAMLTDGSLRVHLRGHDRRYAEAARE
jgi:hypothetical protein